MGVSVRGGEYGTKVLGALAGGRPTWIRDLGSAITGRGGGSEPRGWQAGPGVLGWGLPGGPAGRGVWGSREPGPKIGRPLEQALCRSMGAVAKPCQAQVRGRDGSAGGRGGRGVGVGLWSRREARAGERQGRAGQARAGRVRGGASSTGMAAGGMGPSLASGGKGRGQAVTVRVLWREEDGARALHLGGVAGERASHTGARCRRLLRLSGGLRTQASERQKRSARWGPELVRDGWVGPPYRPRDQSHHSSGANVQSRV